MISASADLISSTLLGGASNDTFNLTGSGVTTSRVIAGGGADVINFSGSVTGASIVGGAGNDSVVFDLDSAVNAAATGNTNDAVTNTYFFGSGGGADTISSLVTHPLTLVVLLTSRLRLTLPSALQQLKSSSTARPH